MEALTWLLPLLLVPAVAAAWGFWLRLRIVDTALRLSRLDYRRVNERMMSLQVRFNKRTLAWSDAEERVAMLEQENRELTRQASELKTRLSLLTRSNEPIPLRFKNMVSEIIEVHGGSGAANTVDSH